MLLGPVSPPAYALAAGALAAAAVLVMKPSADAVRRLNRLLPATDRRLNSPGLGLRGAGAAVVLLALWRVSLTVGPLAASAFGSAILFAAIRWLPRPRAASDRSHPVQPEATEVPAALDVLAACLSGGASLERALDSVGRAFGGGVRNILAPVAALTSWGAPVETAWATCLAQPLWAPAARAVIRAAYSGAALADVFTQQGIECRRALRSAAAEGAQRAGVRAVLPLGLCFLPAFVLSGIVPVVAGFAAALR